MILIRFCKICRRCVCILRDNRRFVYGMYDTRSIRIIINSCNYRFSITEGITFKRMKTFITFLLLNGISVLFCLIVARLFKRNKAHKSRKISRTSFRFQSFHKSNILAKSIKVLLIAFRNIAYLHRN